MMAGEPLQIAPRSLKIRSPWRPKLTLALLQKTDKIARPDPAWQHICSMLQQQCLSAYIAIELFLARIEMGPGNCQHLDCITFAHAGLSQKSPPKSSAPLMLIA
jgi:hypothetical protein